MARSDRFHTSHWGTFTAEVEDGRLVGVRPFAQDPDPSPIIHSMVDAVYDESRIMRPMIRKGWLDHGPGGTREARGTEPFVAVPWDEALDLVATEIDRVRTEHGNQAIFGGSYGWSSAGRFHHAKTQLQRFLGTVGGFTNQVHTYSIAAGYAILPYVLGSAQAAMAEATTWDSIVGNSEMVVAFGGIPMKNTQVSSGGPGQHVAGPFLKQACDAGVEFVNVSPIRDDMADFVGAEWFSLRPNTDMALMLALAFTLETEELADQTFLQSHCVGYSRFVRYLSGQDDGQPKDADWASPICQIEADTIRALARRMAAKRTLINTNWSLQRGDHGEQPFWMTVVLAAMLGQIGLPGGGFGFGYGSMGNIGNPRRPVPAPILSAGENPCDSWIPVARISDTLLNPGASYDFDGKQRTYPDIRLIYWCGGNPFHHHQDLNRLVEAWRRPETIIVNEPWWTATAKFSDIVLPSTTTLERNDIGATSRDRFILAMEQAIEPVGEARHDYDIFRGLAQRLDTEAAFTEDRDEADWLRHLYDRARQRAAEHDVTLPSFDTFWRDGHVEVPHPDDPFVLFADYRADPDLFRLSTPSGRIEIFSEAIESFGYDDCPGHPAWLEPVEWLGGDVATRYPLHMISNQPRTRLHGQMDNGKISRESKVQDREPVWIHPDDAATRGLTDGDVARVFNDRGKLLAGVVVTPEVREGVVQLSTGAWYDPADASATGSLDKHGNPNVLTLDKGTSRLGQGPIAHSTLVEIEKYEGALPPVTAFKPPPIVER
ncbi:MAG: molybdopterin guanine dinucleotide-containing S/N-oxide reductase [Alphaproteobacteria bacterium]|nr:molybdopterin guanine dinucleotide-containing S/N-oxide reductase [Alphaproteobacteria bacterium]